MLEQNLLENALIADSAADSSNASQMFESEDLNPMSDKETPEVFSQFHKELDAPKDAEGKLQVALQFMENAIGEGKSPDFKIFWEARKKCLELFKENLPPFARSQLWAKFSHLSKEARRLKDLFDEQSDFASEQIDMAIQAVEKELQALTETVGNTPDLYFPAKCRLLDRKYDFYNSLQKELNLLNLYASRVTALRKELIKTAMRIRTKNKFFDRLSKAGDFVFPRRKELIQTISQAFSDDIDSFVADNFNGGQMNDAIFAVREEIKALQNLAKLLTLSTPAFSQTRMKLSTSWDQLKEKDKERKVELDKKKEVFQQNATEIKAMIDAAAAQFEAGEMSAGEAQKKMDAFVAEMRARELGRDEVKALRGSIDALRSKVLEKQKSAEVERDRQEALKLEQKREVMRQMLAKAQGLLETAKSVSIDEVNAMKDAFLKEVQQAALTKPEKIEVEKRLNPLKELLREKKEQALLSLPADQQQALEQLRELLEQKREERQETKERVESLRKLAGSSGLGIQRAMEYNAMLSEEKVRLEKANQQVREVEEKIEALEEAQ